MPEFAGEGTLPPGRYTIRVGIADGLQADAVPVELGVQLLGPGETPGLTRAAGELGAEATPTPTSTSQSTPPAESAGEGDGGGIGVGVLVAIGLAGLALGLVATLVLTRRRPA